MPSLAVEETGNKTPEAVFKFQVNVIQSKKKFEILKFVSFLLFVIFGPSFNSQNDVQIHGTEAGSSVRPTEVLA